MGTLHLLRRDRAAIAVRKIEAIAGAGYQDHVPTHVRPSPDRRRHAHVGGNPEGDYMLGTKPLQAEVEVGPDEGGLTLFVTSCSPGLGSKPGRNALPGVPGANDDRG